MTDTPAANQPTGTTETPAALPARGTPEYNQLMVERYENQGGTPTQTPTTTTPKETPAATTETPQVAALPEGGLDKFYNKTTGAYDWANHVKELNYRLTQNKTPDANAAQTPNGNTETPAAETPAATEAAPAVDWKAAIGELETSGKWSDETLKTLEKVIPREYLDTYVQQVEVLKAVQVNETIKYAGGEEELNGTLQWAAKNLTPEEINAYNAQLNSPNWRMALDSLKTRRGSASPTAGEPTLVNGTGGASTEAGSFSTRQEMVEAMSKRDDKGRRLYDIDPDYRQRVRARVVASNF